MFPPVGARQPGKEVSRFYIYTHLTLLLARLDVRDVGEGVQDVVQADVTDLARAEFATADSRVVRLLGTYSTHYGQIG
jgi:hypothetical protein